MIETKPREIKIKERIYYALSKKVLKMIKWETGDLISQHADTISPYSISLFNTSLWKRAAGNKIDVIDVAVEQSKEISQKFKKIEKKYGKHPCARRTRALNKFNKGTIKEEDIEKEQIKFLTASTVARVKMLGKRKKEIKKSGKEFIGLIKNDPEKAIGRIDKLSLERIKNTDEEIKKSEKSLKKVLKMLKKRPITPKPIQNHSK